MSPSLSIFLVFLSMPTPPNPCIATNPGKWHVLETIKFSSFEEVAAKDGPQWYC